MSKIFISLLSLMSIMTFLSTPVWSGKNKKPQETTETTEKDKESIVKRRKINSESNRSRFIKEPKEEKEQYRFLLASALQDEPAGQLKLAHYYLNCDYYMIPLFVKDQSAFEYSKSNWEGTVTPLEIVEDGSFVKPRTPEDYRRAGAYWLGEAALNNLIEAQNNYGVCHLRGIGVPQSLTKAFHLFKEAAEKELAFAQFNLSVCYRNGYGTTQDDDQAIFWLRKAAEQGMAYAEFALGYYCDMGEGIEQDNPQAIRWYRRVSEGKDCSNCSSLDPDFYKDSAENNLGVCYELGEGVDPSYRKAFKLYKKASSQKNPESFKNLAACYEQGKGVSVNEKKAQKLYKKSIRIGEFKTKENLFKSMGDQLCPARVKVKNRIFTVPVDGPFFYS